MSLKNTPFSATATVLAVALLVAACGGDSPETLLASAQEYMAKNDAKAAVIQVKNVLQKQPDSPEARFLLGSALLSTGDAPAAEIELRKARDLKHPDDLVVPKLAQAMLQQGKVKKLLEEFANTQLTNPAAVAELQTGLASAYGADGNTNGAQQALAKALAADPQYVPAQLLQIRQKVAARDVDGALTQLDALLARDGKNADAWRLKGDVQQYAMNALDDALASYRKAVEFGPNDARGHFGLIALLTRQNKLEESEKEMAALKKIAPKHPETQFLDTQLAYVKRDYNKAKDLAQELLRVAPNNARALELSGGIELQRNALVTAEEQLSKAVQAAPGLVMARRWLATTYLRTGQTAKAIESLNAVVNDKTVDAGLLSLLGEAYLMSGEPKKAEELFVKASKLDPDDARKRTVVAVTQMMTGKTEAGLEQLQDIAASDKGTSADLALISTHLRRGELAQALKAVDALDKKTPDSPVAKQLRGRILFAQKDTAGARKAYDEAVSVNPNYFPAVASLAALDVLDQKPELARKRFEELLVREPKNSRAMVALAELRAKEPGDHKAEIVALMTKAMDAAPSEPGARVLLIDYLLQQRDVEQAATVARAGLAAFSTNAQMLDAAGRAQLAAGDTNQGLTTLAKAAALQPKAAAPLLRLADAQVAASNPTAAEQSLRRALELQPGLVEAQTRLMGVRLQQGKFDEALTLAREVQKQLPKAPIGFLMEGDARMGKKDLDGAVAAYQAGLKSAASPELLVRAHVALRQAGKTADADRLAANWLQTQPNDVVVPMYLADAALNEKRLADAEKHYLAVVKVQPTNAVAYNNLAWVTSELKKDGAMGYAQKANELAPNQPAFLDTWAMLLADQKDYKKAIEMQTKVLGLQGANPLFKLNMARIYIKAGEKDNARKQLDELAKLGDKYACQAEVEKLRLSL
jgi:putative PEP-CTERM system TPR-repeat lipoprotein